MLDIGIDEISGNIFEHCSTDLFLESEFKKELLPSTVSTDYSKDFSDSFSPYLLGENIFDQMDFASNEPDTISTTNDHSEPLKLELSFSGNSSVQSFNDKSPEMFDWPDSCSTSNSQSQSRQSNNEATPAPFMTMEQLPLAGFCAAGGASALYPNAGFTPIILQPMMQRHNNFNSSGSGSSLVNSPFESCFNYSFLSNPSGLLKMPEDAIVYLPTPVRALQSGFFYGGGGDGSDMTMSWPSQSSIAAGFVPASPTHMKPGRRGAATSSTDGNVVTCTENEPAQMTEKIFSCSTCTVKFTRRDELRRHEKIHSGEKPLSCPYCDKCFIRSDHRKTHIRTHTGEKPYACDICCKRFARSDEKLRHTKTHFKERSRRRRRRTTTADISKSFNTTEIELTTETVSLQQPISVIPSVATVLDNTFDLSFFRQKNTPQKIPSTTKLPNSEEETQNDPLDCLDELWANHSSPTEF